MKIKRNTLFLLIFLSVQISFYAQTNLSSSPTDSVSPQIVIDGKGRVMVVWEEKDTPIPGIADILFRIKDGKSWQAAQVTVSQLYDARNPDLWVDHNDLYHLVYQDGPDINQGDIFYRTYSPNNAFWSNIERIHQNPHPSSAPEVAVSSDGKPHVLWIHEYDPNLFSRIVVKTKEDLLWPESFINISKNTSSIARHPTLRSHRMNVLAAWEIQSGPSSDIFFSNKIMTGWLNPILVPTNDIPSWPSIETDHQNNIHILYGTDAGDVFHIRRINNQFQIPTLLSTATSPEGAKDVVLCPNNTLHAVWKQELNGITSVFYSRGTTDGTWIPPILVNRGTNANAPRLALDPEAVPHVVWEDTGNQGKRDIFYKAIPLPGGSPDAVFQTSADEGIAPAAFTFDASLSNPVEGHMLSYWWDFGDGTPPQEGSIVTHTFSETGTYQIRLYVTNDQLRIGVETKAVSVLPGPFPPINIAVTQTEIGGLFYREKVNVISWESNPKNRQILPIKSYKIYRRRKTDPISSFSLIGVVSGDCLFYIDRPFIHAEDRTEYTYTVSAVDHMNREGPLGSDFSLT